MKGSNTLKLNQATMVEALQLWVANTWHTPPTVKSVSEDRHPSGAVQFLVELESPLEAPPPDPAQGTIPPR